MDGSAWSEDVLVILLCFLNAFFFSEFAVFSFHYYFLTYNTFMHACMQNDGVLMVFLFGFHFCLHFTGRQQWRWL